MTKSIFVRCATGVGIAGALNLFGRSSDRSSSGLIQHRPGEIRRSDRGDRGAVAQAGMAPQLLHRPIIWAVAVQQQRMPHRGRLLPTQRVLVTAKKQPPVFVAGAVERSTSIQPHQALTKR
jgi:hypothetical protein